MSPEHDDLDVQRPEYRDEVEVDCTCGHRFAVARSLKGGLANCPECRRATNVPGGPEPLFWVLLGGGGVVGLLVAAFFAVTIGTAAGITALAVCAAIILVIVLAS